MRRHRRSGRRESAVREAHRRYGGAVSRWRRPRRRRRRRRGGGAARRRPGSVSRRGCQWAASVICTGSSGVSAMTRSRIVEAAVGEAGRDERAHVGAADREGQREQGGDLHEHRAVDDPEPLHLHLERALALAGGAELGDGVRHLLQVAPARGAPSTSRGLSWATTQTRWSVKTGWRRPGNSNPSGPMIRSRRISWLSNWSGATPTASIASAQPGACSPSSRASGSASTVIAYSDMLTVNSRLLDVGSNSRWLPSSASAASTASSTAGLSRSAIGESSNPRPDPDEQLVVEVLAQPGQRPAHRRLAHRHPLTGVGEVALLEQRVEGVQQVRRATALHGFGRSTWRARSLVRFAHRSPHIAALPSLDDGPTASSLRRLPCTHA